MIVIRNEKDPEEKITLTKEIKEPLGILIDTLDVDKKNRQRIYKSTRKTDRGIINREGARLLDEKYNLGLESYLKENKIGMKESE